MAAFVLLMLLSATGAGAAPCYGWNGMQRARRYPSAAVDAVLVRDLDGDGAPEILASGNQVDELTAFSILSNRGDGTFAAETPVGAGFGQKLQAVADLDGDGVPDLLASDYWGNGIAVYHGRGGLQFDRQTAYGTATHGGPSLIVDADGDGILDIVSLSFGSGNPLRFHLFRGDGSGAFQPRMTYETGFANGNSPSVRIRDGALEILIGERSGRLGVLRYAGGALSVSALPAGTGIDFSCAFGDFNGDGIEDVVDTTEPDGSEAEEPIFITLAGAGGTFQEPKRLGRPRHLSLPIAVRVADLDSDGNADLIVSDFRATSLAVYLGDGSGDFSEAMAIDAGAPIVAFDLADVNGDGWIDAVTANADHTLSVLLNAGCAVRRRRAVAN